MNAKERAKRNWAHKKISRMFSVKSTGVDDLSVSSITKDQSENNLKPDSLEKWANLVSRLMETQKMSLWDKRDILSRFDQYFYNVETRYGVRISAEDRKMYYTKFFAKASGSTTLTSVEMEQLLGEILAVTAEQARSHIQHVLTRYNTSLGTAADMEYDIDTLDFEFFVNVICELQKASRLANPNQKSSKSMIFQHFPIDPDGSAKQGWDFFCLLLLFYCSFSVPYDIAFLDDDSSSLGPLDIFGLIVDAIFMCDICLSFVTSVEVDGIVVRDLRVISALYARLLMFANFMAEHG